jgi:CHAT domain-containing protein
MSGRLSLPVFLASLTVFCFPVPLALAASEEKTPPWKRLLQDKDAKKVESLEKKVEELRRAGSFSEAVETAQVILEIRRREQGPDHWQVADAFRQLKTLEKIASLPPEAQREVAEAIRIGDKAWRSYAKANHAETVRLLTQSLPAFRTYLGEDHPDTARILSNLAANLNLRGQYAEAASLGQKALAARRKVLGEEHPETATSYNILASSLQGQGRFSEAATLCRKVLELRRRILGEEHIDTAKSYNNLATNLYYQAKYAEARSLYHKALALYRKLLGEEHPEIARTCSNLASTLAELANYGEAGLLFQKALDLRRKLLGEEHPDTAASYNSLASNLQNQGKYLEAEPLFQKALHLRRKLLGEEHPDTTISYSNLASNLDRQGKYTEAEPLFQKTLALWRKLVGENHPNTARAYGNLAGNLQYQGRYAEAAALVQKSLELNRKLLGEEHPDMAGRYSQLASIFRAQGMYADAELLCRKALDLRRRVLGEKHPYTAGSYSQLALILQSQGKYAEAELLFRKALDIHRQSFGEKHPNVATDYHNLASNLQDQGKYLEAAPLCQKALDLRLELLGEGHPETATSYTDLAANCIGSRKYVEAERFCRKAMELRRKLFGEEHPETALASNNLAYVLNAQGKYAEAGSLYHKSLDLRRKLLGDAHPYTVQAYDNLARSLHAQGKYHEAEAHWLNAARVFEIVRLHSNTSGLERSSFAARNSPLALLAACLARNGKVLEAWNRREANLARGLLDDLSHRFPQPHNTEDRRRELELLAKLDQMEKRVPLYLAAKDKAEADSELKKLLDLRRQAAKELAQLKAERAAREVYSLEQVQRWLPAEAALLSWLDSNGEPFAKEPGGEHWAYLVFLKGLPLWIKVPGSGDNQLWTSADEELPDKVRESLASRSSPKKLQPLLAKLAKQRLKPLEPFLTSHRVKHLLVHPVGWMAGVPVEALTDRYTISYVPSATMFAKLREKASSRDARAQGEPGRLLALGDPVFQGSQAAPAEAKPPEHGVLIVRVVPGANAARAGIKSGDVLLSYADIKLIGSGDLLAALKKYEKGGGTAKDSAIPIRVWRGGKFLSLNVSPGSLGVQFDPAPAAAAILAKRDGDRALRASQGPDLQPLPGTRVEVNAISKLFREPLLLLGSDASEQSLDELASKNKLKQFRYLHLATHGAMDASNGLESAIFLARDRLPDPLKRTLAGKHPYDGRLTAQKVVDGWKLNAELVVLSACQTGLGEQAAGEGYVGFSQAFFLAGAQSVVVSLWPVDDTATAALMVRFYQNLLGQRDGLTSPLKKGTALREAKSWLRGLTRAQVADLPRLRGLELLQPSRTPPSGDRPYDHPYYWSAFVLLGNPE